MKKKSTFSSKKSYRNRLKKFTRGWQEAEGTALGRPRATHDPARPGPPGSSGARVWAAPTDAAPRFRDLGLGRACVPRPASTPPADTGPHRMALPTPGTNSVGDSGVSPAWAGLRLSALPVTCLGLGLGLAPGSPACRKHRQRPRHFRY